MAMGVDLEVEATGSTAAGTTVVDDLTDLEASTMEVEATEEGEAPSANSQIGSKADRGKSLLKRSIT